MTAAPPLLSINRSLCLVAVDLDGVQRNGGIGTYNWLTAHLLARHGWKVHLLYCGEVSDPKALTEVRARLGRTGHRSRSGLHGDGPRRRVTAVGRP